MTIDAYAKSLVDGLIFYNFRPKLIKLIGAGAWGKVYSIVFTNNMELIIKTSESYLANYKEIQNIKRLTQNKQSPYVCYYYGYTTMENNKCVFVSTNKNLKFVGSLGELPNKVLKKKKINGNSLSYFNIIMEKLETSASIIRSLNYKKMNTIYMVSFIIGCLKGIRDISKNKIVHGDIRKLENIGFIKTNLEYCAPKLLDFGQIVSSKKLIRNGPNGWTMKTSIRKWRMKWPPEMLGCTNHRIGINMEQYTDNTCNLDASFAAPNSDIFTFFFGIVLEKLFEIPLQNTNYLIKNNEEYKRISKLLYSKIEENTMADKKFFINDESRTQFIKKFMYIILDGIELDYRIRPNADDVIIRLYKCLQIYMVQTEVNKIYQPFQKAYIDNLNDKLF